MQRHVGQHRLHQRLVGEMLLEHAAMTRVMQRLRQARAHQAGRGDRAIQPRQLHHLDDGADALALLADAPGIGAVNSTSDEALERLPSLSFSRWNCIALTEPSGAKARHEETGQPLLRLRQHQEGVAHRRRHEPFVAGDPIAIAVALGARHVGCARRCRPASRSCPCRASCRASSTTARSVGS